MSASEYPTTDVEEIKQLLRTIIVAQELINDRLSTFNDRLSTHATGINSIGQNLDWLVQNTKGLFQLFSSPQFAAQMSEMLMGGMSNAGRPEDDSPGT